ncbi:MAG: aromatic ring-hydroxylating dioxygenase subunit alpha [Acidimicrobiales bacterium]|nr:MAG: aromatic ring-hydroxylating dioxygenase subunit alpha [Acidimicrobiales bacterium]
MATQSSFVLDIWYFAGFKPEIKPGKMQRVIIAGHPVNLGRRRDGSLFALRDICPHRAAPLSAGKIIDGEVQCPYHGWKFATEDGQCTEIPSMCADQKDPSAGIKVRTYPVQEQGNLVWVYIAADKKFTGTPEIDPPQFEAARFKPRLIRKLKLNCHVDHAVVGLMDPAHGPFVHQQWWWRSQKSIHKKAKAFEPRSRGFAMAPHSPSSNSLAYKILGGKPVTEIMFQLPNVRTEEIKVGKRTLLSFTAVTPLDENSTEITQAFFTDHGLIKFLSPVMGGFVEAFLHQDGDMVDLQQSGLKYDPKLMLIEDADTQAKWYYARKKEWAASRKDERAFKNPVKARVLKWRS